MGRVVHFEIFTADVEREVAFYRSVFGWDISTWGGPSEYHLVGTGPSDAVGINGGIAPVGSAADQRVAFAVSVADVDEAVARAVAAGATVALPKAEIPGVGWNAYLVDPSGLIFSVMSPLPKAEGAMTAEGEAPSAAAPAGEAGGGERSAADAWNEVGERLREFGQTLGAAVTETASSAQGQRLREQAERAAASIGEASKTAADKARPHVVSALERVSIELGDLAGRLRREPEPGEEPRPDEHVPTPGDDMPA
jgi:uncharacterized protein